MCNVKCRGDFHFKAKDTIFISRYNYPWVTSLVRCSGSRSPRHPVQYLSIQSLEEPVHVNHMKSKISTAGLFCVEPAESNTNQLQHIHKQNNMGWHNMDNQAVLPALIQPDGMEPNKEGNHYLFGSANVIDYSSEDEEQSPPSSSEFRGRSRGARHGMCSLEIVVENDSFDFVQDTFASAEENKLKAGVKVRIIKGTYEGERGKITRVTDKCVFISIDGVDKDVRKTKSLEFVQIIPSTQETTYERGGSRYVSDNESDEEDDGNSSVEATCEPQRTYTPEEVTMSPRRACFNGIVSDDESDEGDEYESSDDDDDEEEEEDDDCPLSLRACLTITEGVLQENNVLLNKVKRLEDENVKLTEDALLAQQKEAVAHQESENFKDLLDCPVCFEAQE